MSGECIASYGPSTSFFIVIWYFGLKSILWNEVLVQTLKFFFSYNSERYVLIKYFSFLGDFAVLISSGMTVKQAMLANFLSACSSFIGLVIGIIIGQQTEEGNQWVFAIMGGMFLYIALVDMVSNMEL